jgi:hypothetical protein
MFGYNYNRPQRDTRFQALSEREDDESTAGNAKGKALSLPEQVSYYDKKLLAYIVGLHNATRGDYIRVDDFASLVDGIAHLKQENDRDYLSTLVHPEQTKGSKIPSPIPVPSSSFQLHTTQLLSTNASGNLAIAFNPCFLDTAGLNSTFFVNNNAALTGSNASNFFTATNFGQTIPAVYSEYRVVSASMVIKYTGRLDIVQGVIGGAIIFDNNLPPTAYTTVNASLAKYGDFNLAMDSYYTQENMALNGVRTLYFPLDSTFEQYQTLGSAKTGFNMFGYVYGGVPSAAAYKVDIFVNYECLADAQFLNYMPTSTCHGSAEAKSDAIKHVQTRPVTAEHESKAGPHDKGGSFWDSIKSTLGDILPSVGSILSFIAPEMKVLQPIIQAGSVALKR